MIECVKVTFIVIFAMVPEIPTPLELTYIAPFTSQATTARAVLFASRVIPSVEIPKHTADHLSLLGSLLMVVSALALGLSLVGYYERLIFPLPTVASLHGNLGCGLSTSGEFTSEPSSSG